MKLIPLAGLFNLLLVCAFAHAAEDEAEIRAEIEGYRSAWNAGDAAVVDVAYEVSGIRAEVDFPVHGRNTVVMIKRDGRWMRAARRNSLKVSSGCLKQCDAAGLHTERLLCGVRARSIPVR